MRTRKTKSPEVNTGSMADIAFLLLIFFLVTATIPNDEGINRKLSKDCPPGQNCDTEINERNLLRILLNEKDEIFMNEKIITIDEVETLVKEFIDNNGNATCNYCHGKQLERSSEHPKKAIISIEAHQQSSYKQFVAVQNELTKAYSQLRKQYAISVFNKFMDELTTKELKQVKNAYPFLISEAAIK